MQKSLVPDFEHHFPGFTAEVEAALTVDEESHELQAVEKQPVIMEVFIPVSSTNLA